jgi:hypothetical protein
MPATGLGFLIWNYVQERQISFKSEIEEKLMGLGYTYPNQWVANWGFYF